MIKRFLLLAVFGAFSVALTAYAADTTPPTTPTSVYAAVTQSNQVYVSWAASTDDTGVIGYYLYRNGSFIASIPGYTFFTDNASPGTYSYTVTAYDAAGNISPQSSPTSLVTVISDTTPPTAPTNLTLTQTSSSVTLSWNPSTDNFGVVGYYIYRNNNKLNTGGPVTAGNFTDTGLAPGNTYTYTVAAYDAAGNTSDRSNVATANIVFDVSPPSTPQNVIAKVVSSNEVDLSWRASTDNIGVVGYNIYRDGSNIGSTTSTSYADIGLGAQTSYSYTVNAYDAAGNFSNQTYAVVAQTFAPDVTPPSIPGGITALPLSASSVSISWFPSTDNIGVVGYYIYRDDAQINAVNGTSTSYTDTYLTTSTTYTYAVAAYDAAGNVSPKTSVAATTLAKDPVTPIAPPPTPSAPSPAPTPAPTPTPSTGGFVFTTNLYFGLQSTAVQMLQLLLIQQGYLGAGHSTGYFGGLTQAAVKQFQCTQNLVCKGGPASTGWGSVGPRTRAVLNTL